MAAQSKPGTKAPYPGFIEPALATTTEAVPSGQRWVHEIKFDGYRVQVHLRNAVLKIFTRRGHDWTDRFRKVAVDAWNVNAGSAIIDGEVVVPSTDGTTDFSVLQNELNGQSKKIVRSSSRSSPTPMSNSARALRSTVRRCTSTPARPASKASSPRFGIAAMSPVAVTIGSRKPVPNARPCRSPASLSGEIRRSVSGQTQGRGVAVCRQGGHGFEPASAKDLQEPVKPLIRRTQPYSKKIAHRGIWVEPSLLAEIEYRAKSAQGKVRHPVFKSVRRGPVNWG
jgi:bifunctional non-homologous end joining protein LigD